MTTRNFTQLGELLQKARTRAGLTQEDVAKELGYTHQFISNWERGISSPPCRLLRRIAAIYGISATELYDFLLEGTIRSVKAQLENEFRKAR